MDYEILLDEFRYTASPVFQIAGQAMIFMHIQRGFPTLILPQFEEGAVLRWMQSGRLTGVFLVPTMITRLLDDPLELRWPGVPGHSFMITKEKVRLAVPNPSRS